ncbi:MAG TPA: terminase small subunit [Dissulfurispiraceae bacterium]|nr:terminase small subunit [Dissulfurispiraceae bacterium]
MAKALTAKQKVFVQEYLVDLNATQAAIRAGYSQRTAGWIGPQLLGKTHIAEAVQGAMAKREERTEITQDRVLKEYAKLAFLDPRRFYNDDGQLLQVHELPEDVAAALSSMEVVTERAGELELAVRKIKFSDKKAALDSIARHLGMFKDKTELTGDFPVLNLVLNGPGITRKAE